jgi:hypothetical protein
MLRAVLGWLAWLQDRDIEGTALSFVVCQLTLAVAASAGKWASANEAAVLLFLPTVLLAAFFLRFIDGSIVLMTAFFATWYFIVPPQNSFTLSSAGALELGIFVFTSGVIVIGAVQMRKLLKRPPPLPGGVLPAEADLVVDR